jgi:hypothetical protein
VSGIVKFNGFDMGLFYALGRGRANAADPNTGGKSAPMKLGIFRGMSMPGYQVLRHHFRKASQSAWAMRTVYWLVLGSAWELERGMSS